MRNQGMLFMVVIVMAVSSVAATPPTADQLELATRLQTEETGNTKGLGGSSPLVIPAAAFATNGNYDGTYFFHPFEGYMRGKSTTDGCVQAPVYLPQGARIFQIYASILDEDAAADIYVTLKRSNNFSYHDSDELGSMNTSGSTPSIQSIFDTTIDQEMVDYPQHHYWVQTCLPSADTKLFSVRIYFVDSQIFSDSFESSDMSAWSGVSP